MHFIKLKIKKKKTKSNFNDGTNNCAGLAIDGIFFIINSAHPSNNIKPNNFIYGHQHHAYMGCFCSPCREKLYYCAAPQKKKK